MFAFYVLAISCLIDLVVYAVFVRTFDYNNYSTYASILSLLLLLAAQLITKRLFGENINAELNNRHWLFYIASLSVCIITSLIIFVDRTISPLSLSIVCGAFLLVNIIISYLIDDLVNSSKNALENQVLRDQMRAYEREIILQNEKVEILRSFRHDMKHHFSEISALASVGDTKQIKKYVSNMDDNLKETTMLVDSGNTGLDTVLNYMLQRAVDKDIPVNVRVAVPEELELSAYDMNIILGNLIENAIEAQKEVNAPGIDLIISYSKDSLIIELSNTYSHKVRFKEGLPVTTKRPASEHGYGIRNVRKVLDKYTNTLDFDCSDDRFTVRILMKIL
ncbi:MAG: GHKL domain-containing protein [Lachnospiraceae bacterium]|nr:GHKL domain-containing protein [Lachnospiraceae bacterium]